MTSQNHMTEGSHDFVSGSYLWYDTTFPSLVAISIVVVKMFITLSRHPARAHDWSVKWLQQQMPLKVSHCQAKFNGHKHCSSGYKTALVCHVMSQDHIIKGSCDKVGAYRGKLSSCKIWWPKASGSGDIMVYVSSPELARPRNHRVMRLYG